jgi:tripartite-type tricarboxylate transporter receptor subunit TctC
MALRDNVSDAAVVRLYCDGFVAIRCNVSQGSRVMLRSLEGACQVLSWSLAFLLPTAGAQAQSVESFFRGKTLSMVIGYPTGGSNDIYARSVARHIGKHIPGNPTVVPRNMPGGGSLVAANHVFNVAPKDGTTLALIAATIPLEERLGAPNVMFKSAAFNWIGRVAAGVNMTFVMNSVPVKTIQDTFTREVVLGASGRSSTVAIYPAVLSNVIGTRFKLVMGYQSSNTAMLAMERGEVEGHSTSLEVVRAVHPEWLSERKVTPLVQYALKRHPELPDIPMSWELGRNDEEKQILRIVANATEVGKMVLSTPDTPAERITALRRAFDATMQDPAFVAELKAQRVELAPMTGEELQKLVAEVGAVSPDIIDKVKAIYPLN